MRNITKAIMASAIATASITDHIQPAQAQNYNVAGRWQCQNSVRGLTRETKIAATIIHMIIDAHPDGTFQAQQLNQTGMGNYQVVGGGNWQVQNNSLTFAGQGQSSLGRPEMMIAMGNFQDANTIKLNRSDRHFANSYACRKIQ
ncbi:MAG: hypothetical protein ACFCAD_17595 [Pleurocapsa sp.]